MKYIVIAAISAGLGFLGGNLIYPGADGYADGKVILSMALVCFLLISALTVKKV